MEEEFEDIKGVIRIRISKKNGQHNDQKKKNRQHNDQKKKNRQHNDQKKKDKETINDLQNIHHTYKTKDRVTRTPLKPGVNSGAPEVKVYINGYSPRLYFSRVRS